ncbi:MAG: fused MFS/spermidine synthase [Acidobacteriota bacterium]
MSTPATRSSSLPGWLFPVLLGLFALSGACALVYQVLWLRLLALVFGVTVYAASTVLASFMAGLAVGSFGAGRIAPRLRSPLAVFGAIELGIGLTAFLTPVALDALRDLWVSLAPTLPSSLAFVTLARFGVAFALLIVPTSLMGATLPIVVRSALGEDRAVGGRLGLIYATNTAGAIVGAVGAGFYLISEVGVTPSFALAASTNTFIGVTAIVLSRRLAPVRRIDEPKMAPADAPPAPGETLTDLQQRLVLWTFALSGVTSLALEVIWFRMLVVFLRPTAYAFTIMLAAVLAGIAAGSYLISPLLTRRLPWLPIVTVMQLAISLAALLSFNTLAQSQALLDVVLPAVRALGVDPYLGPIVASSLAAMLPTTLLLGAAFPIGLLLWTGPTSSPASAARVGVFYALNVFGAIAGSVVAGFLLLPALGSRGSLIAASGLALAASVALALSQWTARPNFAGFMAMVGPVAFAMTALNSVDPFDVALDRFHRGEVVLWRQEGVQTTVTVHERQTSGRPMRIMYLDGMHQANDSDSTAFVHHRIGALPVMLHPNPKTALVVGLGGGATAGAVSRFPGIDIDVVELSEAVVQGSSLFNHINFDLLSNPRVTLRVDDGRNYLLATRRKYDVITADIILPRHAGAGSLYSKEYFELVRGALAPGGIALQWIAPETRTEYALIMRTFLEVFPHTTLWGDGSLMVGTTEPFTVSKTAYEARRQDPAFRALFDWDWATIERLYAAGPDELRAFVGEGPLLTDDKPVIEYFLSLPKGDPPPDLRSLRGDPARTLRP